MFTNQLDFPLKCVIAQVFCFLRRLEVLTPFERSTETLFWLYPILLFPLSMRSAAFFNELQYRLFTIIVENKNPV